MRLTTLLLCALFYAAMVPGKRKRGNFLLETDNQNILVQTKEKDPSSKIPRRKKYMKHHSLSSRYKNNRFMDMDMFNDIFSVDNLRKLHDSNNAATDDGSSRTTTTESDINHLATTLYLTTNEVFPLPSLLYLPSTTNGPSTNEPMTPHEVFPLPSLFSLPSTTNSPSTYADETIPRCAKCGVKKKERRSRNRLVRGHNVGEDEYPWMALVSGGDMVCGGAVINSK